MNLINYLFSFWAAFSVVIYELSLAQTMTFYLGNTVLWYSLTIGGYFLSQSLGSLWAKHKIAGQKDQSLHLTPAISLSLTGGLAVIFLKYSHALSGWLQVKVNAQVSWVIFFLAYSALIFALAFWAGCIQRIVSSRRDHPAREHSSDILDYAFGIGALGGSGVFVLFLLTARDWLFVNLVLGLIQLALTAAVLLSGIRDRKRLVRGCVGAACVFILFILCLAYRKDINQFFLKDFYYNMVVNYGPFGSVAASKEYPLIERHNFSYHHFDIVKVPAWAQNMEWPVIQALSQKYAQDPRFPKGYMFFLDGNFVMRSDHEEFHNEYLVHIPIILNGSVPRRVLIIERGAGLVARELVKYPSVREITQISLNEGLNSLAHTHPLLQYINKDVFKDLRMYVNVGDAFRFLKNTKDIYDAVYIDVPVPNQYDHARYYSREFFALIKAHLEKDGFAVLRAPGNAFLTFYDEQGQQTLAADNKWEIYYQTFNKAGFQIIRPYVTNLELTHETAARQILLSLTGGRLPPPGDVVAGMMEGQTREVIVNESILRYVYALQEGFIMLKPENSALIKRYHDNGVALHVLNADRFRRALMIPYPVPAAARERKVNSIIRPTLADLSWWGI